VDNEETNGGPIDTAAMQTFASTTLIDAALKVLAALAFWIVGRC